MALSSEQIKGRIKNVAQKNSADARVLLRIYMMERFLERVSASEYKDNFIIKGGMLITSMIGVSMRSTMDIDTSIKNVNLSEDDVRKMITEISAIDLGDGASFKIKDISNIMDEMEYPGIRVSMDASIDKISTPLKIDVSTGDIITPREIIYDYPLMLEDRKIKLWAYNLETVLAEKLQTILVRGVLNTRMRDLYDLHVLLGAYRASIDPNTLINAFDATNKKRDTENILENVDEIFSTIRNDDNMQKLWESYRKKYSYAKDITYEAAIDSAENLVQLIKN